MKTASVLFGLVVATGVAHAKPTPAKPAPRTVATRSLAAQTRAILRQSPVPAIIKLTAVVQRPRVDASGDMACGNVMSKIADDTCTARLAAQQPTPQPLAVAHPLVDADGDVAAGNVMKKTKR